MPYHAVRPTTRRPGHRAARRRLPMVEFDGTVEVGQCGGRTTNTWQQKDTVYLHARGVSHAVLTEGRWDEVAHITCYLRDGDRAFLTYSTTGRGNEPACGSFGLLDTTPYGRGEAWEDKPAGWPEGRHSCWYWCSDADGNTTWGPTSRPVPQWTRPGATPVGHIDS